MTQSLTQRLDLIKNTPGTGEQVNIAEINAAFDQIDANKIPAAKLLRESAPQPIATGSAPVEIDFSATVYDTWATESEGAMASIALNGITCRIDGIYWVCASIFFASNATGSRILNILKNGSIAKRHTEKAHDTANNELSISWPMPLTSGDILTCSVSQTSGGSLDLITSGLSGDPEGISLAATWMGKKP